MSTQVKLAKQALIAKHKLLRNSSKTVSNYFAFPQNNQAVHIVSNCEFQENPKPADNQPKPVQMPPIRLQTKITPIFTKNHGYPRLVQEFQFFIGETVIKYTNVTTSMPERKDDAFMSQLPLLNTQNQINDYYFESDYSNPQEEGKIIEESATFDPERLPNRSERQSCANQSSSLFGDLCARNHPYEDFNRSAAAGPKATNFQEKTDVRCDAPKLREGEISSLSGTSILPPPIPLGVFGDFNGPQCHNSSGKSSGQQSCSQLWRGREEVPDNSRKQVFKVIKKRICKEDKKICEGQKLGCKVH